MRVGDLLAGWDRRVELPGLGSKKKRRNYRNSQDKTGDFLAGRGFCVQGSETRPMDVDGVWQQHCYVTSWWCMRGALRKETPVTVWLSTGQIQAYVIP